MSNNFPVSEYDQYLSFVDVENAVGFQEAWKAQDKEKVDAILYSLGVDLENGYEVEVNTHRTRISQQVEYGPRFSFSERTDKEWQKTGMSIEDQIANCSDISLQIMLKGMSKRGFGKCDTVKTVEQLAISEL